jgi:Ni/Co efflux regulator RcnB
VRGAWKYARTIRLLIAVIVAASLLASSAAVASPLAHPAAHHKHHKKHKKHRRRHHRRHHHHASTPPVTPPTTDPATPPTTNPATPPTGTEQQPPADNTPTIPTGNYSCYHTTQLIGGGYFSSFKFEVDLHPDLSYHLAGDPLYYGNDHWSQQGDTVSFTSGPLWDDVNHAHDQGTWYPGGAAMPHAGSNVPAGPYTLVIRDTLPEGGDPPSAEFSTTDRTGGPATLPTSFAYCKLPG